MDPVPGADDTPAGTPVDADPVLPGSLGPHPERHPDDLPPGEPRPRRVPAGVAWAVVLAIVVLAIASLVALSTEPTPDPDIVHLSDPDAATPVPKLGGGVDMSGRPAPSTTYTAFDGGTSSLTAHAGTPLVVNFWASSCAPCITEMPAFERVHQAAGDDVAFIGLAVSDPEDAARALAERTGITYELGFDPVGDIITRSGGTLLPTTVFVNADGTIAETHALSLDEAGLRERIRTNFGIEVPETR